MAELALTSLAKRIKAIISDLKSEDSRIRALENKLGIGTDPANLSIGTTNQFNFRIAYPFIVTNVNRESCLILGRQLKIVECNNYEIDNQSVAEYITVASSDKIPSVGEIIYSYVGLVGQASATWVLTDSPKPFTIRQDCESTGAVKRYTDVVTFAPLCMKVTPFADEKSQSSVRFAFPCEQNPINATLYVVYKCERKGNALLFSMKIMEWACGILVRYEEAEEVEINHCCISGAGGSSGAGQAFTESKSVFMDTDLDRLKSRLTSYFANE